MEHILYVMSAMNPPYGLNYSMYYWNHGLQRVARIEAVCECFNDCEWECVWMSGLLIIWNGNKKWVLMGWREYCHEGFQLQIGKMVIVISMHDGFGYSGEWCWFSWMIVSKKQREYVGKWYLSVVWKQQRLQVVFLWQVNDKEIIRLSVVD